MKVYLHGSDGVGWSIDSDRYYTQRFLTDLGYTVTKNIISADVLHSVWWNQLLEKRCVILRCKKRIIAVATNQIDPGSHEYLGAKKWVRLWIAPSRRQYGILKNDGVRVAYQPFYVDETIFKKIDRPKDEIARMLGIDFSLVKGRFLIGSFQRDTVAADLKSPKWQKGPDDLLAVLAALRDRDRYLLLLAGPRRHYIMRECDRRNIPYYFYGKRPGAGIDDIMSNTVSRTTMALLYNLVDCYVCTSRSEGGPKAVAESSFCRTPIFSTAVGMAPDILDKESLCKDAEEMSRKVTRLLTEQDKAYGKSMESVNYRNAMTICSYHAMKERWGSIYSEYMDPA